MISTFTALIDSNVFYGARLRSLLLWQAQTDLFRARWTPDIHREWIKNLLKNEPGLSRDSLERTRQAMDNSVIDCIVTGYESLIESLTLPDPDDRHVLAAAITGGASVIVTFNLKHFPDDVLKSHGLHALHPDEFLLDVADLNKRMFAEMAQADFTHYKNPPLTFDDYLTSLEAAGVPMTATLLRDLKVLIASDS